MGSSLLDFQFSFDYEFLLQKCEDGVAFLFGVFPFPFDLFSSGRRFSIARSAPTVARVRTSLGRFTLIKFYGALLKSYNFHVPTTKNPSI